MHHHAICWADRDHARMSGSWRGCSILELEPLHTVKNSRQKGVVYVYNHATLLVDLPGMQAHYTI